MKVPDREELDVSTRHARDCYRDPRLSVAIRIGRMPARVLRRSVRSREPSEARIARTSSGLRRDYERRRAMEARLEASLRRPRSSLAVASKPIRSELFARGRCVAIFAQRFVDKGKPQTVVPAFRGRVPVQRATPSQPRLLDGFPAQPDTAEPQIGVTDLQQVHEFIGKD